ncbi:glycine/betaine ABC transporter substrate-binding protein [Sinorhizobium medicae]|uniref:Substrate-binding region of ABC-type glycine betaine transport system n=1 Tax=Sinorhizobium medicae (strain WSM419) TaxID=366394 RepID=A6UJQ0_SINMW|nr:glycine betaine ABC transporter substrate-binding protein [Sinorhizobium medicae]ABR63880.1 Substrate-binding region of ABC-type glycine betaine transport system [Sinorhizobium medicae WSM419]MDX0404945.1 glycine/betaine ABC transporter substrate-binding protein [Sinorhizobium medicae]MDX0416745.1 glycine/betaine ABC transporter substrate-binding protein [Sinorhizobium medicae]MDX0431520.1 glycine/betaine ABC transporter substrate-binding protein [Sinorhizobium medicae]MDX0435223.1 glycine/
MNFAPKLAKTLLSAAAIAFITTTAWAATLTVGGKNFTEQLIIAEITKQLLESKGHTVDKKDGMGTKIVRAALENGEVDLYWEYTGTSLITFNKVMERLSPEETYSRVKELDGEKGLVWLAPSAANNTYAYVIKPDNAKTEGMETISDLAKAYNDGKKILMGTTAEFPKRPDGLIGLEKVYGFETGRANVRPMDLGLAYNALANGDLDTIAAQATDGQIAALGLKVLKDDKGFFPNYALTPVVRKEVLDANPDLKETLEAVSMKLDDATMQRLNSEVDVEKKTIEAVAADYLKSLGM